MSRTRLPSGITTFYANYATGSDSNDGSSPTNAFKTVNYGLYYIYNNYDFCGLPNNSQVVLQMADNVTDLDGIHFSVHSLVGAQSGDAFTLQGGTNSKISVTAKSAIELYYGTIININNVTLESSGGFGLVVWYGAIAYINGVKFGCCTYGHMQLSDATILQNGTIYITGNSPYHLINTKGRYESYGNTIEIQSDLSITAFILNSAIGYSAYSNSAINTNSHTITGQRYQCYFNSVILSGNQTATYFPGNSSGTTGYGGVYM